MPQINLGGSLSNLPPNIVEQIMAAERIPVQTMENKKVGINAKLALVNDLDGRVKKLSGTLREIVGNTGFRDFNLDVSREGIVAGSVNPELAKKGSHSLEVVKLPKNAGTMTNGLPDRNKAQLGVGYIKFNTSDGAKEVYINDKNNTLDGIAATINNSELGIHAAVVKDANDENYPYKVILTGDGYGKDDVVEFPTVYLLDGEHDLYFDQQREAENGVIKVNGFEVDVDSKSIDNLIPGVTLDLLSAEPGREVVVTVSENYEAIEGKLSSFVEAVNGVLNFIQTQNRMDETTDTTKTLGGSSLVRSIETRMRRLIQGGFSAGSGEKSVNRLQQLGIEFNRAGTVDFNQDKFEETLRSKPKAVVAFLNGSRGGNDGFLGKVDQFVRDSTQNVGVISNRRKSLESRIRRIDRNIENKERMLERKEQSLRRKFSNLEENLGRLRGQQGSLAALGSIPGI